MAARVQSAHKPILTGNAKMKWVSVRCKTQIYVKSQPSELREM